MSEIKVQGPEGCVSVNVGGDQYNINDDGFYVVDESVFPLLAPHGFLVVGPIAAPVEPVQPVEPEAKPEEKPKAKKKAEPADTEAPTE